MEDTTIQDDIMEKCHSCGTMFNGNPSKCPGCGVEITGIRTTLIPDACPPPKDEPVFTGVYSIPDQSKIKTGHN